MSSSKHYRTVSADTIKLNTSNIKDLDDNPVNFASVSYVDGEVATAIAQIPDVSDHVTNTSLTTTLGDYVTNTSLNTTLQDYATVQDTSDMVTTTELNNAIADISIPEDVEITTTDSNYYDHNLFTLQTGEMKHVKLEVIGINTADERHYSQHSLTVHKDKDDDSITILDINNTQVHQDNVEISATIQGGDTSLIRLQPNLAGNSMLWKIAYKLSKNLNNASLYDALSAHIYEYTNNFNTITDVTLSLNMGSTITSNTGHTICYDIKFNTVNDGTYTNAWMFSSQDGTNRDNLSFLQAFQNYNASAPSTQIWSIVTNYDITSTSVPIGDSTYHRVVVIYDPNRTGEEGLTFIDSLTNKAFKTSKTPQATTWGYLHLGQDFDNGPTMASLGNDMDIKNIRVYDYSFTDAMVDNYMNNPTYA